MYFKPVKRLCRLFNFLQPSTTTTVKIYRRMKKKADMAKKTLFYHRTKC